MKTKTRGLIVLLLLSLILSGCTSRFLYNRLGWMVNWYVDDFISFDREQQADFDRRLAVLHQWHREEQLPLYVQYLERTAASLEAGLDADTLSALQEEGIALWDSLMQGLYPDMQQVLAGISDEQLDDMARQFERQLAKFNRDYVEPGPLEQQQLRLKNARESLDRWAGSVKPEQEAMMAAWAVTAPELYTAMARQRQLWQDHLLEVLHQRDEPDFGLALRSVLLQPDALWSDDYLALMEANQQSTRDFLLNLLGSLTPEQKRHMLVELREMAEDVRQLMQ